MFASEVGPRFPPTSNAYNEELRDAAVAAAKELGIDFLHSHGTYCFVSGPMYESKAECRFLRALGGDCVGMSTIPEVITAHHCNMQVLCISLVTNKVVMEGDEGVPAASHAEVLEAVGKRSVQMQSLVKQFVVVLGRDVLGKLPDLSPVNLEPALAIHRKSKSVEGKLVSSEALAVGSIGFAAGTFLTALALALLRK